MKIAIKKIYILIIILPLLGAVSYKNDDSGGCIGYPNFENNDDGKVTLIAKSVNKIEKKKETIVLGEVENTTNNWISEVKVLVTLKDSSGSVIDSSKTVLVNGESKRVKSDIDTIDSSALRPNGKGSFKITTEKADAQNKVDTVETTVTYSKKKLTRLKGKMLVKVKKHKRSKNRITIRGTLKNISKNIPTWNNKVVVVIKNKAGIVEFVGEKQLGDTLTINGSQKVFAMDPGAIRSFSFKTNVDNDVVEKIIKNDLSKNRDNF